MKNATHKLFPFQDRAIGRGTHWAAIWAKRPNRAFYFDSYGERPNDEIRKYLLDNFERVTHNKHKFQSIFSDVCGQFTICFLYFMSLGFEFDSVMHLFRNSNSPDQFVREFVNANFV
jgi:hypothetical protein